jgi:pyruvate,water dikinase
MKKYGRFVLWFDEIGRDDVRLVGGKNASLGEMISKTKVPVPPGFAITSEAYWYFIKTTGLENVIRNSLKGLNVKNISELKKAGKKIREAFVRAELPIDLKYYILEYYHKLRTKTSGGFYVAVRSSATAEDLPNASFAGQQETYLNVTGKDLIKRVKQCFASLFTDRAISYREDKGFDHFSIALSVGVQKMVNPKASGVMFTIDPDTGFRNVVIINSSYGLGEYVVQGVITPDEFTIFKPTLGIISRKLGSKEKMLIRSKDKNMKRFVPYRMRNDFSITDKEVKYLANYALVIEKHYKVPMDVEWAKDHDNKIYIVQARPETVHGAKDLAVIENYVLKEKGKILLTGCSIGSKIGRGEVNVIKNVKNIQKFRKGQVLVTEMTNPSWEPIMKIASAIVTDKGGVTSHAAIVSRELGIPCIVDTVNGTKLLRNNQMVTVDCTSKLGKIFQGLLKFDIEYTNIEKMPKTKTKILVNVGMPDEALKASKLPVDGVGLARQEFIINSHICEHPLKMIKEGREDEFINKLSEGIASIVAPFYPRSVIVRLSDFKTNEYASLKGGKEYEPYEENPMIGWRGASRYIDPVYEPAFRLECRALKRVRDEMGLKNLKIMVPFCRTIKEAESVLKLMKGEGLEKGKNGLEIYVMAEIPSNIILADDFSRIFNGFSIGSNDLTQLTLGIDRDNEKLIKEFDERNDAVKSLIKSLIKIAHKYNRKVGICGEAPSNYPDFTKFLVKCGIDSISVNLDVAMKTKLLVSKIEADSR